VITSAIVPLEKLLMGPFDLVKIGFGAIVGLLGGKSLNRGIKPAP
jgi:hypothetical protein